MHYPTHYFLDEMSENFTVATLQGTKYQLEIAFLSDQWPKYLQFISSGI